MKPEHFKPMKKPKRRSKIGRFKSRILAVAREGKTVTSPQLHEAYSTKTEWAKKLIPKLGEESEGPKQE
jgi:hypothetical protein